MKYLAIFVLSFTLSFSSLFAQDASVIKEMKWGLDYKINLVLSNDSTYVLNVEDLFTTNQTIDQTGLTYYPVSFSEGYVKVLKDKNAEDIEEEEDVHKNLWRALNSALSGSYAHFLNCVLYAIESEKLQLTSAEMTRPETDWKPNPVTESYKRTKKWKYYVPVDQKLAIKEYKLKLKNEQLSDLEGIPEEFLELFLNTSSADYTTMKENGQMDKVAKIDLVKLLLGSNYLGEEQIKYIKASVLNAALEYKMYDLPSIIIFNNFNAAVAMTLEEDGYAIDAIVFSIKEELSDEEKEKRTAEIENIIANINEANQKAIEKKLKRFYK